jgi:hypothetical protein
MFLNDVRDGELVVPPGKLFMMGDNRENSADSRYWGLVPRESVVGKPVLVYWSYDAPTADFESWSLDHLIDVATHFFTKTRWNRTFRGAARATGRGGAMNLALTAAFGWLVPGGAYLLARRYLQFAVSLALVSCATVAGIALHGANLVARSG